MDLRSASEVSKLGLFHWIVHSGKGTLPGTRLSATQRKRKMNNLLSCFSLLLNLV